MSRFANAWEIQHHLEGLTVIIFRHELAEGDEMIEPIVLVLNDALALGAELSELPSSTSVQEPTSTTATTEEAPS